MDVDVPTTATHSHQQSQTGWVSPPNGDGDGKIEHGTVKTCWDDATSYDANISAFLHRWPPSRTPKSMASWISVLRYPSQRSSRIFELSSDSQFRGTPPPPPESGKIAQLQQSFLDMWKGIEPGSTAPHGSTIEEGLDRLALAADVVIGKWIVFVKTEQADELWARIVRYICLERKCGQAKISAREDAGGGGDAGHLYRDEHAICVYVRDYFDREEMGAVRSGLRRAGVTWRIAFKPDAYTHLGIYAGNPHGIRPFRYYDDEL